MCFLVLFFAKKARCVSFLRKVSPTAPRKSNNKNRNCHDKSKARGSQELAPRASRRALARCAVRPYAMRAEERKKDGTRASERSPAGLCKRSSRQNLRSATGPGHRAARMALSQRGRERLGRAVVRARPRAAATRHRARAARGPRATRSGRKREQTASWKGQTTRSTASLRSVCGARPVRARARQAAGKPLMHHAKETVFAVHYMTKLLTDTPQACSNHVFFIHAPNMSADSCYMNDPTGLLCKEETCRLLFVLRISGLTAA